MPDGAANGPEYLIDVRGLSKRFGPRVAIAGLSLSVRPGEICGLAGANGGGKSTALRLLAGLLVPDCGTGSVLGHDLWRGARQVRHLPAVDALVRVHVSVRRHAAVGAHARERSAADPLRAQRPRRTAEGVWRFGDPHGDMAGLDFRLFGGVHSRCILSTKVKLKYHWRLS